MILMVSKTAGTFATARGRTPSCNTSDSIVQMLPDEIAFEERTIRTVTQVSILSRQNQLPSRHPLVSGDDTWRCNEKSHSVSGFSVDQRLCSLCAHRHTDFLHRVDFNLSDALRRNAVHVGQLMQCLLVIA